MIMMLCLSGCSELRVIGSAAMRELHADAMPVNWKKTTPERTYTAKRDAGMVVVASNKIKSFSSFRSAPVDGKRPVKGLWEQHGG
jgi:hypothetical protein